MEIETLQREIEELKDSIGVVSSAIKTHDHDGDNSSYLVDLIKANQSYSITNIHDLSAGTGTANQKFTFKSQQGLWMGNETFASAPFSVNMKGDVVASSITITGGTLKYGKTLFTDSVNAGYWIGSSGIYMGSAADATYLKYTIGTGALDVYGGTITGNVIRTSSGTTRVQMDGSGTYANEISFYYAGNLNGSINSIAGPIFRISNPQDPGLINFYVSGAISLIVGKTGTSCLDFLPMTSATYNLGSSSYYWKQCLLSEVLAFKYENIGYIQHGTNVEFRFPASSTQIDVGGEMVPINDSSLDLGTTLLRWYQLYTDYITCTADIVVGGTVDGVDISAHAVDASAHHSSTSNGLTITPATVTASTGVNPDTDGGAYLGTSSLHWSDLYVSYVRFKSTAGQIYFGSGLAIDFYSDYILSSENWCPAVAGSQSLGTATYYWADVSYKTLTDRGCLGCFDDGVELQDGSKVSDLEAIKSIQKHPTLKTVYGVPRFDYSTMPKAVYSPAPIAEEDIYDEKDENKLLWKKGEKMGEDGAETTALISILIGTVKELDNRIKNLEKNL
jgi:hypothetical protein